MRQSACSAHRRSRASRARSALVGLLVLFVAVGQTGAASSSVAVERDGDRFSVVAQAVVNADARTAWETLTDYERLPQFIPGIQRTRVLARGGGPAAERLTVEYAGRFLLLVVTLPTHVWLDVRHLPLTDVLAESILPPVRAPGDPEPTLRAFSGRYTLTAIESPPAAQPRVRLVYTARFELAEPLPPVIGPMFGTLAVRHALREQFEAMVAEIERRAATRPAPDPAQSGGG